MITKESMTLMEKLEILTDAAKYDVACTSSGSNRKGKQGSTGNTVARGICHCFAADGRCISLLKILLTNECIFDCKYCQNRSSHDILRARFSPKEVAKLTIEFYRRNYIEGLFLSSGVVQNPDFTMEQMIEAVFLLRTEYHFNGYIHAKTIPGANTGLVEELGLMVDRMSVNLELPTSDGLRKLAPNKTRKSILTPMRQIQSGIKENKLLLADRRKKPFSISLSEKTEKENDVHRELAFGSRTGMVVGNIRKQEKIFVPAGQSTQMIVGATPETDYQIIHVAQSLYKNFDLKRVFYSAFVNTTFDSNLPVLSQPPLLREHRLYQADFLMRFYGFEAGELLSEHRPNFNVLLDPKCNWAICHLEQFPVEINKVSYGMLLRVPGIGVKSAQRIIAARKFAKLDFPDLKKLGVVLKRALYFITCNGKMMYPVKIQEDYIINHMTDMKGKLPEGVGGIGVYCQLSLFDDVNFVKENPEVKV